MSLRINVPRPADLASRSNGEHAELGILYSSPLADESYVPFLNAVMRSPVPLSTAIFSPEVAMRSHHQSPPKNAADVESGYEYQYQNEYEDYREENKED